MDGNVPYEDSFSDYKRNEQQEMIIAAPLDLSFRKASTMDGMLVDIIFSFLEYLSS